jgi:hypothetical protein
VQSLRIIDTLSPFFPEIPSQADINWSKVPFASLETDGDLSTATQKLIVARWQKYLKEVAEMGYNAISVDDLAHLVVHDFYGGDLKRRLKQYRRLYTRLFDVAKSKGMQIFVNSDYIFRNAAIETHLASGRTAENFFKDTLALAFDTFPQIDGVILRIGENDGIDVQGDFLSSLEIRSPAQANAMLKWLLPLFEQYGKTLVFRTWSIGAYAIGDLIWNPATFDKAFGSISSPNFIISMKFGDTDFMRYLKLNPLFFRSQHRKIIELQTRREWEGMGVIPSFVGWDYERYLAELQAAKSVEGVHVWCQTGGWANSSWYNTAFLDAGGSFWNELNTYVVAHMANSGISAEEAVRVFCASRRIADADTFLKLLKKAETAILEGLYIQEFAQQTLYFRRTRMPSLLWIAWDRVLADTMTVYFLRAFIRGPQAAVSQGRKAARAAAEMVVLAKKLKLPRQAIDSTQFAADTFALLADVRGYICLGISDAERAGLSKRIAAYHAQYPQHYRLPTDIQSKQLQAPSPLLTFMIRLAVRRRNKYRLFDRLLLATSPLQLRIARYYFKKAAPHLTDKAMGIDIVFR